MTRYVLLNESKTNQLINMPIEKTQFHPVEAITDRICTVITMQTGCVVDELKVFANVEAAWNGGVIQSELTINNKKYFLLFVY